MATFTADPRASDGRALRLPGRVSWKALLAIIVVALAYRYSLFTLARGLTLQTPLAYLALVPVTALLLIWVSDARSRVTRRPARELRLDFVLGRAVGFGLVLTAIVIAVLLPSSLGPRFWLYRLDLLSLPFFVGGLVALFFGLRRLWAVKTAILFLLLAWPVPYALFLGDWLDAFTNATAGAVRVISGLVPIAQSSGGDPTLFFISHGGASFAVSIGSACSGVNSLVGFILIGGALTYVVRGRLLPRLAWLALGLLVLWSLNVARIELVLLAGALLGPDVAFDALHPVAGLIVFNLGLAAMLWLVPRFGLRFLQLPEQPAVPGAATSGGSEFRSRRVATGMAVAVGLAMALVMAAANGGYARYEQIAGDLGTARLVRFDIREAQVPGWSSAYVANVEQARQFFGSQATWDRLLYTPTATATLRSASPIFVDVIDTSDAGTLAAYGIEDCYHFHHFRIDAQVSADIGAGVSAEVITYFDPIDRSDWSAVWWEWPKESDGRVRYERVVVFLPDSNAATLEGFDRSAPVAGTARFHYTQQFLITVARDIVRSQQAAAAAGIAGGRSGG